MQPPDMDASPRTELDRDWLLTMGVRIGGLMFQMAFMGRKDVCKGQGSSQWAGPGLTGVCVGGPRVESAPWGCLCLVGRQWEGKRWCLHTHLIIHIRRHFPASHVLSRPPKHRPMDSSTGREEEGRPHPKVACTRGRLLQLPGNPGYCFLCLLRQLIALGFSPTNQPPASHPSNVAALGVG